MEGSSAQIPSPLPTRITSTMLMRLAHNCAMRLVAYSPQRRYGRIEELYTGQYHITLTAPLMVRPIQHEERDAIVTLMQKMPMEALAGRMSVIGLGGLRLNEVACLACVRPITGRLRDPVTGELTLRYASDVILIPLQLLTPVEQILDPHIQAIPNESLQDRLQPRESVIFLGNNRLGRCSVFGGRGVVMEVHGNEALIHIQTIPVNWNYGHTVLRELKPEKWYSLKDVVPILKLSIRAILKVAGYYPVYSDDKKRDIGLGLYKQGRVIPGMSCEVDVR